MKGMACRALYEEKDIIYEATVLDVNDEEKTAYVEMLGIWHYLRNMFELYKNLKFYSQFLRLWFLLSC